MTFELHANDEVVKTFTYAEMTEGSITIDKIKPGTYTVVETCHPDIINYTFDLNNSVTSKTDNLNVRGELELPLKNDYKYITGSLELNKTVNFKNWDNSTTVPDSVKDEISFTITGPYGYSKTVSYREFNDGKLLLTDLEPGEYTIIETNKVTGYTWTYKVNNAENKDPPAKVDVERGKTASVSFENTYVQQTADLTIKKTASGAAVPEDTKFNVTFPDGTTTRTFTYSEMTDGVYVLNDVPLGTYTVEEIYDSAKRANYSLTVTGEGEVTLTEAGKDITVHQCSCNCHTHYSVISKKAVVRKKREFFCPDIVKFIN